jgi:hypothetical protein
MKRYRIVAVVVIVLMMSVFLTRLPQTHATFVIAGWDYPDEYGQGIEAYELYENSTGSWVLFGGSHGYEDSHTHEWNASLGIKIRFYTWFNSTLTGASTSNEGKLYQRHSIIVSDSSSTVFSQQNFTYFYSDTGIDPPMWYYGYEVVLNLIPIAGIIYTVVLTYEIFYYAG